MSDAISQEIRSRHASTDRKDHDAGGGGGGEPTQGSCRTQFLAPHAACKGSSQWASTAGFSGVTEGQQLSA